MCHSPSGCTCRPEARGHRESGKRSPQAPGHTPPPARLGGVFRWAVECPAKLQRSCCFRKNKSCYRCPRWGDPGTPKPQEGGVVAPGKRTAGREEGLEGSRAQRRRAGRPLLPALTCGDHSSLPSRSRPRPYPGSAAPPCPACRQSGPPHRASRSGAQVRTPGCAHGVSCAGRPSSWQPRAALWLGARLHHPLAVRPRAEDFLCRAFSAFQCRHQEA